MPLPTSTKRIRLDPKYVPALVERAYLWQCRNRLDLALADVNQAIKLDSRNSYAYVERGVFHFRHERVRQSPARLRARAPARLASRGRAPVQGNDPPRAGRRRAGDRRVQYRHSDRSQAPRRLHRAGDGLLASIRLTESARGFRPCGPGRSPQSRRPRGAGGLLSVSRQERQGARRLERSRSSRSGVRESSARCALASGSRSRTSIEPSRT